MEDIMSLVCEERELSWEDLLGKQVCLKVRQKFLLGWDGKEVTIEGGSIGVVKSENGGSSYGVEFTGHSGLFYPSISALICLEC